jgi:hypothetical protein
MTDLGQKQHSLPILTFSTRAPVALSKQKIRAQETTMHYEYNIKVVASYTGDNIKVYGGENYTVGVMDVMTTTSSLERRKLQSLTSITLCV